MEAKVITIANRLNRKDSVTGLDVWYTTKMSNISYSKEKVTTVNGTQVSMGESYNILIPFTEKYMSYDDWKSTDNRDSYYTISQGDFIFLANVLEDIQTNNIIQLKNKYEPFVCEVRSVIEVPRRNGATIQLKVSGV